MASLPHLVRWNTELKNYGLVVVAPHMQEGTPEQVTAKAQSLKLNFAVTDNHTSIKRGLDFNGIPHCIVFDHTGKCLFRGKPDEAEKPIRAAVGKGLVEGLDRSPASKSVAPITHALMKGEPPLSVLPKLVALERSGDLATAGEAKMLVAKLTEYGRRQIDEAETQKGDDPVAAFEKLEPLPVSFKGTPVATRATALLTELRKDRTVAAELKARPSLDRVKKLDEQLKPLLVKVTPKDAAFKRLAGPALQTLQTTLQQMKKAYPDTRATREALDVGDRYGITVK